MGGAKFAAFRLRMVPILVLLGGCTLSPNPQSSQTLAPEAPRATSGPGISLPRPSSTPTPSPNEGLPSTELISPNDSLLAGPVTQIEMFDDESGWAIARIVDPPIEHVLRTDDGGASWQDVTPPEGFEDATIGKYATAYFASPDKAWLVYTDGVWEHDPHPLVVWRTRDGGQTWEQSNPDFPLTGDDFPDQIQFVGDQQGWLLVTQPGMAVHGAFVASSDDGGIHWNRLSYPDEAGPEDEGCAKTGMSFRDLAVGWVVGDCMFGVYFNKTTDGGKTWSHDRLGAIASDFGSYQLSKPRIWPNPGEGELATVVVSSFGKDTPEGWLMMSADGGSTWTPMPLPKPFGVEFFLDASTGWYAGTDGYDYQRKDESSIFRTTDGGETWSPLTVLPHVAQMDCVNQRLCWAVAGPSDAAVLMRSKDGGASWSEVLPLAQAAATPGPAAAPWRPCFDAPESRLRAGMDAYVSFDPSSSNRLRTEPGLDAGVIVGMAPGTRIHVNFGPRCGDQLVWWNVTVDDTGVQGWTAEADGFSSWLISGTPTPSPAPTPSRTPFPTSAGPEVFDVDPHDVILDPEDFPSTGLVLTRLTDRTNSEILSLRGEDAGRIYLEDSGRILGVTATYSPESPDSSLPSVTSILVVLFKTASGPVFLLNEKGGPCREDEGRFYLQDADLGLGDVSVLCSSDVGESWVRVGYRNVYFDVSAVPTADVAQDEWLIDLAEAQLRKLASFPLSESVSISPGD